MWPDHDKCTGVALFTTIEWPLPFVPSVLLASSMLGTVVSASAVADSEAQADQVFFVAALACAVVAPLALLASGAIASGTLYFVSSVQFSGIVTIAIGIAISAMVSPQGTASILSMDVDSFGLTVSAGLGIGLAATVIRIAAWHAPRLPGMIVLATSLTLLVALIMGLVAAPIASDQLLSRVTQGAVGFVTTESRLIISALTLSCALLGTIALCLATLHGVGDWSWRATGRAVGLAVTALSPTVVGGLAFVLIPVSQGFTVFSPICATVLVIGGALVSAGEVPIAAIQRRVAVGLLAPRPSQSWGVDDLDLPAHRPIKTFHAKDDEPTADGTGTSVLALAESPLVPGDPLFPLSSEQFAPLIVPCRLAGV